MLIKDYNNIDIKKVLLNYMLKKEGALTYYQIDRKLSSDNLQYYLSDLRNILASLEEGGYISIEEVNQIKQYSITEKGKLLVIKSL